jgi:hypothetical protein
LSSHLFEDLDAITALPAPIAESIGLMLSEIEESGEHTTADELSHAIEAVFTYLGRLWVAEYLQLATDESGESLDEKLNRFLFEALGRKLLLGHWVGVARRVHQHFAGRGLSPLTPQLLGQDFGTPGDMEHPVAKLVSFRNDFSHGSFNAAVDDIRSHRRLLEEVLEGLPALATGCPVVHNPETGEWVRCSGGWERIAALPGEAPAALQPVSPLADGGQLNLYPLLWVEHSPTGYALRTGGGPGATHSASAAFERNALRLWLERYEHERKGHLDHKPLFAGSPALEAELAERLGAALKEPNPGLILVEAHPGCTKSKVIGALVSSGSNLPLGRFDDVLTLKVLPGDLGQSGYTFARMILRRIEGLLGLDEGHFKDPMPTVLTVLESACEELAKTDKRLLVGLDQLNEGQQPYRGEPLTVLDVYGALVDTSVTVVATSWPGSISGPLLFDQRIPLPPPDPGGLDKVALNEAVAGLCDDQPLRQRVLAALCESGEPNHLFQLCDSLETSAGDRVFEPAVERDLWDLRPLLVGDRHELEVEGAKERVRVWSLFSPAVSSSLKEVRS